MAKYVVLKEKTVALLKEFINQMRSNRIDTPARHTHSIPPHTAPSPDVYVAQLTADLPGLSDGALGTGGTINTVVNTQGVITSVSLATGGMGYSPGISNIFVVGGDNNAVVQITVNSSGVITSVKTAPIVGGTNYPLVVGSAPGIADISGAAVPGLITALIYQIVYDANGLPHLRLIDNLVKNVFNISPNPVSRGWVTVMRSKFGDWLVATAGGCAPKNAIIQITVLGNPTLGSFSILFFLPGVTPNPYITFMYNDTATIVRSKIEAAIPGTGTSVNVIVTGGPFPNATMQIQFVGQFANTFISLPLADWQYTGTGTGEQDQSLSGGPGIGVICSYAQLGTSGG
jgi:hypothetical protein